jgi:acyl dehydratase
MNFEPTSAQPINRSQIARYACVVGDFNPMHVDEDFARSTGMPSVIAHGPLSAALVLDRLVAQVGVERIRGVDVRLRAPVFPGDSLEIRPTDDGCEVVKSDGTIAMTMTIDEATE